MKKCRKMILVVLVYTLVLHSSPCKAYDWKRNTFPGQGHVDYPGTYLSGWGQDRTELLTCFRISPINSDFMIQCMDMPSSVMVCTSPMHYFHPAEMPHGKGGTSVSFSPYNTTTAFVLASRKTRELAGRNSPYGLWRTTDGTTWEQVYDIPTNSYENTAPAYGKQSILYNPNPAKSNQVWFGSFQQGLMNSGQNGASNSWSIVAFTNRLIKTLSASTNETDGTDLYVIVGPEMSPKQPGERPIYRSSLPEDYIARWDLSQNTQDYSLNNQDITLFGFDAERWTDSCPEGLSGLSFPIAGGAYASINNLALNSSGYTGLTVCAWVQSSSTSYQNIASFDRDEYWRLMIRADGTVSFGTAISSGTVRYANSTSSVNDGDWHFVTGTFDQGDLNIYIDGKLEASTSTGDPDFGTGATRYGFLGTGSCSTGPDLVNYLRGNLDDVRIYDRALGAIEVERIYLRMDKDEFCYQGELWRLDVNINGWISNKTRLHPTLRDFTDVEVNPNDSSTGFVIRKGVRSNLIGGRELYRFTNYGETQEAVPLLTKEDADATAFGYVFINPYNTNHVVITAEALLSDAFLYSTNSGATWQGMNRTVTDGLVEDFETFIPYSADTYPTNQMPEDDTTNQGPTVGFLDENTVIWWSTAFGKTLLKSTNYGATFKTFGSGTSNKRPNQISIAGTDDGFQAVALDEYGFVSSINTGCCWEGASHDTDPGLSAIREQGVTNYPGGVSEFGFGIQHNPDNPEIVIGVYDAAPAIVRSTDGGLSWTEVNINGPSLEDTYGTVTHPCVFWNHQDTNIVYVGNLKSTDGGLTWSNITNTVMAMSASNGDILVAMKRAFSVSSPYCGTLMVSTNAGGNWVQIPKLPRENVELTNGTTTNYFPIRFAIGRASMPYPAISIDPSLDPTQNSADRLRLLLAGRSGIYEYNAAWRNGDQGTWTTNRTGLANSIHYNRTEPVPWMGFVQFDPADPDVVYAAKTAKEETLDAWNDLTNLNHDYEGGQPYQPLYRSTDGGKTWTSLHTFSGIPDYMHVMGMEISVQTGDLYVLTHFGIYQFPADTYHP